MKNSVVQCMYRRRNPIRLTEQSHCTMPACSLVLRKLVGMHMVHNQRVAVV